MLELLRTWPRHRRAVRFFNEEGWSECGCSRCGWPPYTMRHALRDNAWILGLVVVGILILLSGGDGNYR